MKKIIICDKNKELIDALQKLDLSNSKTKLEFVCGDVIELHKNTPDSRIVTASNPDFNPGGGLDKLLSEKYSWEEAKEFSWNDDLFFVISVGSDLQSNKAIIKRALAGVFAQSHRFTMILTGLGTGIGGLRITDFVELIADLSYADLSYANLSYANLRYANLRDANLSHADLSHANLRYANLRYANLSHADLSHANLRYANLRYANLRYANLRYANLSHANLSHADLSHANLRYANLRYANLSYANLSDAKNLETVFYNENTAFFALQCPEEGSFIGWKKAKDNAIVKLLIPEYAKRSSATSRKCRCSEALVVAIYDKDGKEMDKAVSSYNSDFIYKIGEMVKVDDFDENRWEECSAGIHFFITRKEAEMYN